MKDLKELLEDILERIAAIEEKVESIEDKIEKVEALEDRIINQIVATENNLSSDIVLYSYNGY